MFQLVAFSSLRERSGRRQQPCGAEPCAFFITKQSTTRYWAKYQVPGTVGTCVYSSFCFFVVGFVLHLGLFAIYFFFANCTRTTADQNVTSPTYSTAQHRQGNQLRTSSSRQYQIASCTKKKRTWASSFCPLHIY